MRGWRRTGCFIGSMWLITWLSWQLRLHTLETFLVALVGTTGLALVAGCLLHEIEG